MLALAPALAVPPAVARLLPRLLASGKLAFAAALAVIVAQVTADPAHALTKQGMVAIAAAAAVAAWQAVARPVGRAAAPPAPAARDASLALAPAPAPAPPLPLAQALAGPTAVIAAAAPPARPRIAPPAPAPPAPAAPALPTLGSAATANARVAAAVGADAADAAFTDSLALILKLEGGYANDPDDPGGATMKGVTQRVYDSYRRARNLAPAAVRGIAPSELHQIYRGGYWRGSAAELLAATHPKTALCHFDCAVNCGTGQAAKLLQRAVGLPEAAVDGRIGPRTLAAVRAADDAALCAAYLERRAAFYRGLAEQRPASAKFLASWLARLRHVARAAGLPIAPAYAGRA
jgi:lysozyme family protein